MSLDDRITFREERGGRLDVRRFRLVIVELTEPLPDGKKRGFVWESRLDSCSIGADKPNDLAVNDKTVSRFHCEVKIEKRGAIVRDLGSTNGTFVDGVRVESAHLRHGSLLKIGRVVLRFELLDQCNRLPPHERNEFGTMVSSSVAMRSCFALMARAAACDATVLFEGETGTGKTTAAKAIHRESARRSRRFRLVDCSALPTNLIDDELFGHDRGAFTGATEPRKGVFEEADGGTVFLDEIGELPLDLQSKLLRVLEEREVHRLGSSTPIKVDVRVIAATHKDLRAERDAGHFREDLYYRLDVLRVRVPALRERPEDIPLLCDRLLDGVGASVEVKRELCTPEYVSYLKRAAWPGNIRELRNHLERCKVLGYQLPVEGPLAELARGGVDPTRPFKEEKERAREAFEREYLEELLRLHGDNVTRAAVGAELTREYLHKLLKEHRIRHQ